MSEPRYTWTQIRDNAVVGVCNLLLRHVASKAYCAKLEALIRHPHDYCPECWPDPSEGRGKGSSL